MSTIINILIMAGLIIFVLFFAAIIFAKQRQDKADK